MPPKKSKKGGGGGKKKAEPQGEPEHDGTWEKARLRDRLAARTTAHGGG
jgi:hypothetical protein